MFRLMRVIFALLFSAWLIQPVMPNAQATQAVRKPLRIPGCANPKIHDLPRDLGQVMHSVVIVQNGGNIGSGVLISRDGYVLTAAHLVQPAGKAAVYLNSGETRDGRVLRWDASQDVALIKVPGANYPCLPMNTSVPAVGSKIFSIGFLPVRNAGFSISTGMIRSYRSLKAPGPVYVQTDLALRPGNSGGPLLDRQGRVVGIISRLLKTGNQSASSLSAPINAARQSMQISLGN